MKGGFIVQWHNEIRDAVCVCLLYIMIYNNNNNIIKSSLSQKAVEKQMK